MPMSKKPERRRHARRYLRTALRLILGPQRHILGSATEHEACLADISDGGMRLEVVGLVIDPDIRLRIRLESPDGRDVRAIATVVRCDDGSIAFRFDDLTGDLFALTSHEAVARLHVSPLEAPRWWQPWWGTATLAACA